MSNEKKRRRLPFFEETGIGSAENSTVRRFRGGGVSLLNE